MQNLHQSHSQADHYQAPQQHAKRKTSGGGENNIDIEDVDDDTDIAHFGYFHPLCVSSVVVDSPRGHKEIAVAIRFPSWTSKKNLKVDVGSNQTSLGIFFTWPPVISDSVMLHRYWIKAKDKKRI